MLVSALAAARQKGTAAAVSPGGSAAGQAGVTLLAALPPHLSAWVTETDERGLGGAGPVGQHPVAATCALMRMAAELIRTPGGAEGVQADVAMACVEALQ